jgi:hypothetical protein
MLRARTNTTAIEGTQVATEHPLMTPPEEAQQSTKQPKGQQLEFLLRCKTF